MRSEGTLPEQSFTFDIGVHASGRQKPRKLTSRWFFSRPDRQQGQKSRGQIGRPRLTFAERSQGCMIARYCIGEREGGTRCRLRDARVQYSRAETSVRRESQADQRQDETKGRRGVQRRDDRRVCRQVEEEKRADGLCDEIVGITTMRE